MEIVDWIGKIKEKTKKKITETTTKKHSSLLIYVYNRFLAWIRFYYDDDFFIIKLIKVVTFGNILLKSKVVGFFLYFDFSLVIN